MIIAPRILSAEAALVTEYPHKLSAEEKTKLDAVLVHLRGFKLDQVALSEAEQFYLSEECLLRFLRATKWNQQQAITRIEGMLRWRRDWRVDNWTAQYISPEQETGKQLVYGFDRMGRPVWLMRPKYQNTACTPRQLHHMFYFMHLSECVMPKGVEQLCLWVDYKDKTGATSISQGREALSILQNHYPERLGQANFVNLPWAMTIFFRVITPFVDPATMKKVFWDSNVSQRIPAEQLEDEFGGTVSFKEYNHQVYWFEEETSITAFANVCRTKHMARWRQLGGTVGIREWDSKAE